MTCEESSISDEPCPKVYFSLQYGILKFFFFGTFAKHFQRMTVSFSISVHLTAFRSRFLKLCYAIHCLLAAAFVKKKKKLKYKLRQVMQF